MYSSTTEPRDRQDLDARRIYYVYYHKRVGDTYPFYVGKGKRGRAFDYTGRNPYWNNITTKNEFETTIVVSNLDEMLAYEIEKALIFYFWRLGHCEANLREGGEGGVTKTGDKALPIDERPQNPRHKSSFLWVTPAGTFRTTRDAGEANKCDNSTVSRRCRNPKFPAWYLDTGDKNE